MKKPERKKRTRIIRYEPDTPTDPNVQMVDNTHTPNPCLGQPYLDQTKREALAESKRRIAENTIKPKKPNWKIWHKTERN